MFIATQTSSFMTEICFLMGVGFQEILVAVFVIPLMFAITGLPVWLIMRYVRRRKSSAK